MMLKHLPRPALLMLPVLFAVGCAAYAPPGRGADMANFGVTEAQREYLTDGSVQRTLDRKPLAHFPTGLAVVRVQGAGYKSYTCAQAYGTGKYSVVTQRVV